MKTCFEPVTVVVLILILLLSSSCSLFKSPVGFALFQGGMAVEGPNAVTENPSMVELNLNKLFDLGLEANTEPLTTWDDGFAFFERKVIRSTENVAEQRRLRNGIQDRIIAASNQRCGEYKDYLKRFDSETNIGLGWLTTALAGAGAIATPAGTVRALSGIAAILSGWRAEVNESYFNKLTIQVITSGIESKRKGTVSEILVNQKKPLADYSLQAAVADASTYHHNCSLISGLEHAALSIQRADDPGLIASRRALIEIRKMRQIQETPLDQPIPLEALTGTRLRDEDLLLLDSNLDSPLDAYTQATRRIGGTGVQFAKKLDELVSIEDFKNIAGIKTYLDNLKTSANDGRDQIMRRLEVETKQSADKKDAELRQKQSDMNQELDSAESRKKQDLLRLAIVQGRKITLDITEIELDYQLAIQRARTALDNSADKAKPGDTDEHPRIKKAREVIQELTAGLLKRRTEATQKVLQSLDEESPDGKKKLDAIRAIESFKNMVKQAISNAIGQDAKAVSSSVKADYAGFVNARDSLQKKLASLEKIL